MTYTRPAWRPDRPKHSATCAECQAELDALYQRVAQLKAMPSLRPARDRWPAVREAVRADKRQQRRVMAGWGSLAAAAVLATLFVVQPLGNGAPTELAALDTIKQRSASIESRLTGSQLGNRVMSGWEAALAAELEDRIAVIDGQLETRTGTLAAPRSAEMDLWRRRVDLMEQLYTVRRAAYQGM